MSRSTNPHTRAVLGFIDDTQRNIDSLISEIDFWVQESTVDDRDAHLWVLRQWQTKLARLNTDLQQLYRRLD